MNLQQLAMLAAEAAVMAAIVIGLFRARTVLGLTPLYIVLGGMQYLEATLTLRIELMPGIIMYPASTVLFPATLMSVLLIYVKDDAIEARKLVYGLTLANLAAAVISLLIGWHLTIPGTTVSNLRARDFLASAWISTAGTGLLLVDVIGIILCYEFIGRYVRGLFLPFFSSLLIIVAFDNLIFMGIVRGDQSDFLSLLYSGLLGKASTALFYSIVSWIYLTYAEPRTATVGSGDVADVFQRLTYRQKYEQARQRMVRDALTGLFNRGHFDETLPRMLDQAKDRREPLSLLIIDVDNFKEINDGLSHVEGDRALQLIARTVMEESRGSDVPCRYGGDEFVVLMPATEASSAAGFAARLQETLLDRCRSATPPYPWGTISTTIGVASYPSDPDVATPSDMIRVADQRLYEGKRGGRDRIVSTTGRAQPDAQ
jgi:diguanylate cyclase (GGDEF)-like protein